MTTIGENTIDLAVAFDWVYDKDFINLLKQEAEQEGLSVLIVSDANLSEIISAVKNQSLTISALIDRESETSPHFCQLQNLLNIYGTYIVDPISQITWASDKATMHLEFIANSLNTPYTIILDPFDDQNDILLSSEDLACLGRPFIIKPANTTGGGVGVVDGAESLHDVLTVRREFKKDKYLLQEKVRPFSTDGKRFWFRGIYAFGLVQCAWWDDCTHIYSGLNPYEVKQYGLTPLYRITKKIAGICGLSFFSTEIVLTESRKFVVVDYVNESCDMRYQSSHADGVPDKIISNIINRVVKHIKKHSIETGNKIVTKILSRCDRISMERLELANITVARDSRMLSPLVLTSAQIFIGGMILLVVSIPVEGLPGFHYPVAYYGVLLWLSMVSAVGFSIWFSLLKKAGCKSVDAEPVEIYHSGIRSGDCLDYPAR